MSWKDYFYFTSSQRRALILLSVLSLLLLLVNVALSFTANDTVSEDTAFLAEIDDFTQSLKENKQSKRGYKFNNYYDRKLPKSKVVDYFKFNPNTLDSLGFVELGLPAYVIRNILRYRLKGGEFKSAKDFSNVYGLSKEQYEELEAYVIIPVKKKQDVKIEASVEILLIEINSADTTQLKLLKGIGSGFAKRIVSYRRKLGGFYTKSQLQEVWGLSEEIYKQIAPQIIVNKNIIKRIPVNISSIERLRNHPYINFYQARAIYEYRRNEGRINSIEACKMIDDESLTEAFWKKAGVYLEF